MPVAFQDKTFLIGIGAQRAGTTWLADYFADHPEIYMSPIKEMHYFDAKYIPELCGKYSVRKVKRLSRLAGKATLKRLTGKNKKYQAKLLDQIDRTRMIYDENGYIDFFKNRVTDEKIFCEITPAYSMLPANAFGEINQYHKNMKFLFIMRRPIDRYWSHIKYSEKNVSRSISEMKFVELLDNDDYFFRTDYKRTIENLESKIPAENIIYLFYENLFEPETLKRLSEALGIEYADANFSNKVNASKHVSQPDRKFQAAYDRFSPIYRYIHDKFDDEIPEAWLSDMATYG